ncbi:hypothetical protein [Bdellovibrio bacteriovorus]|uniref:hypothetical protein n=1 Tax=Bdellovibrio bacteriovorus TaxID=959 RepID=UPI0035A58474
MKIQKALPYILASLLLLALISMAQSPRVLLKTRVGDGSAHATDAGYFHLPPGSQNVSAISEQDYLEIIGKFVTKNFLKAKEQTGLSLYVPFEWQSPWFGAYAKRTEDYSQISLLGGMARAPGATKAALVAILCHELGHHIGGAPLQTIPSVEWSSSEGQSDFYAATQCLPEMLQSYPELASEPSQEVLQKCGENLLCARTMQAGLEMIQLTQRYSYRDYTPVQVTASEVAATELIRNRYPTDQCRLDTFVQGALCQLGSACRAPVCWLPEEQK